MLAYERDNGVFRIISHNISEIIDYDSIIDNINNNIYDDTDFAGICIIYNRLDKTNETNSYNIDTSINSVNVKVPNIITYKLSNETIFSKENDESDESIIIDKISELSTELNSISRSLIEKRYSEESNSKQLETELKLIAKELELIKKDTRNIQKDTKFKQMTKQLELYTKDILSTIHTKFDTFDPLHSIHSGNKGVIGELVLEELFQSIGPWISIENTRKIKHSCDLHIRIKNTNVLFLVESKNYTYTIPKEEFTKFKSDVKNFKNNDTNGFVVIGLFISFNDKVFPWQKSDIGFDEDNNIYINKNYISKESLSQVLIIASMVFTRNIEQNNNIEILIKEERQTFLDMIEISKSKRKQITNLTNRIKADNELLETLKRELEVFETFNKICKSKL